MKKHLFFILLFFSLSSIMRSQTSNNKYENEWKNIEQLASEDLPQSALQSVDDVLKMAIAEKNNTQVIKALIYKNKFKKEIDFRDNEGILSDLGQLLNQSNDTTEKALLNSMLAEAYLDYYNANSWEINRRTNLSDVIPDDIKEWTGNIFVNKIADHLKLSVADNATLKKHTTKEYDDIINLGKDTERFPTLYDFLMKRAIEIAENIQNIDNSEFDPTLIGLDIKQLILPADEFVKLNMKSDSGNRMLAYIYYQQYLKDLLDRNMTATIISMEIGKITFTQNKSNSFTPKDILDTYLNLEKK